MAFTHHTLHTDITRTTSDGEISHLDLYFKAIRGGARTTLYRIIVEPEYLEARIKGRRIVPPRDAEIPAGSDTFMGRFTWEPWRECDFVYLVNRAIENVLGESRYARGFTGLFRDELRRIAGEFVVYRRGRRGEEQEGETQSSHFCSEE